MQPRHVQCILLIDNELAWFKRGQADLFIKIFLFIAFPGAFRKTLQF